MNPSAGNSTRSGWVISTVRPPVSYDVTASRLSRTARRTPGTVMLRQPFPIARWCRRAGAGPGPRSRAAFPARRRDPSPARRRRRTARRPTRAEARPATTSAAPAGAGRDRGRAAAHDGEPAWPTITSVPPGRTSAGGGPEDRSAVERDGSAGSSTRRGRTSPSGSVSSRSWRSHVIASPTPAAAACRAADASADVAMSTAVTRQPWVASQIASPPSPHPTSSARRRAGRRPRRRAARWRARSSARRRRRSPPRTRPRPRWSCGVHDEAAHDAGRGHRAGGDGVGDGRHHADVARRGQRRARTSASTRRRRWRRRRAVVAVVVAPSWAASVERWCSTTGTSRPSSGRLVPSVNTDVRQRGVRTLAARRRGGSSTATPARGERGRLVVGEPVRPVGQQRDVVAPRPQQERAVDGVGAAIEDAEAAGRGPPTRGRTGSGTRTRPSARRCPGTSG